LKGTAVHPLDESQGMNRSVFCKNVQIAMSLWDTTTDEIANFRESPENLARNQPQNLIFQIIRYGSHCF
jgi:hypothetical protein